jgi:hypothetical protein
MRNSWGWLVVDHVSWAENEQSLQRLGMLLHPKVFPAHFCDVENIYRSSEFVACNGGWEGWD